MKVIQQSFAVKFEYPVVFTKGLFDRKNSALFDFLIEFGNRNYKKKLLFVIDDGVFTTNGYLKESIPAYFSGTDLLECVSELIVIPGGEKVKNEEIYFNAVLEAINKHGIDRHSFVVAIGGGAVLDTVGYAAAVAHRGVKLIRVPTTVLSQNDSAVGVKNSINYFGKKNFLGTFAPAVAVFNDSEFLKTLSPRDRVSGISEAIKVALIKDSLFFEWLESNSAALADSDESVMAEQIYRSAELHLAHIRRGDPFELGSARPLDFGHWAAHKLEYLTQFEVKHGEAVAIGIALDVCYSHLIGKLTASDRDRVLDLLEKIGFHLFHPALSENNKANLWNGLNEFREHLGGRLTITLLESLGQGYEVHDMDFDLVKQAVDFLENRSCT
jgi:3-dehydroquinate synthase